MEAFKTSCTGAFCWLGHLGPNSRLWVSCKGGLEDLSVLSIDRDGQNGGIDQRITGLIDQCGGKSYDIKGETP